MPSMTQCTLFSRYRDLFMYNSSRRLVSFRNCIRFQQVLLAASHPTQIHKSIFIIWFTPRRSVIAVWSAFKEHGTVARIARKTSVENVNLLTLTTRRTYLLYSRHLSIWFNFGELQTWKIPTTAHLLLVSQCTARCMPVYIYSLFSTHLSSQWIAYLLLPRLHGM